MNTTKIRDEAQLKGLLDSSTPLQVLAAARELCECYFQIAAAAIGEDAVRSKLAEIVSNGSNAKGVPSE